MYNHMESCFLRVQGDIVQNRCIHRPKGDLVQVKGCKGQCFDYDAWLVDNGDIGQLSWRRPF